VTRYYLYLAAAVLFLALQFTMNKLFQSKNGSGISTSLLYTTVSGALCGILFFAIGGFSLHITLCSFLYALGIATLCTAYNLMGFKVFSLGNFSDFTMFLMLGGMLLPFGFGLIFLNEGAALSTPALIGRLIAVLLLVVSLIFPCTGRGKSQSDPKKKTLFILLCLLVFIMNGFVSVLSKLHQIETLRETMDAAGFVCLSNSLSAILSGLALLAVSLKTKSAPHLAKGYPVWKLLAVALFCALFNGGSYLLQLLAAASPLPASVQYPFITGGSVVLTALSGFLFFKERPDKRSFIGILLSFAATFLFLI